MNIMGTPVRDLDGSVPGYREVLYKQAGGRAFKDKYIMMNTAFHGWK